MAAPLGFKTFATGDVLTAADTNGYLMQGIWAFANAAARDAAVTSPQEGNFCYLKDTNATQFYTGSAWSAVGGGGGKVLQVVQGTTTTAVSNSTSTLADTTLTATITPSSATSKVLVMVSQNGFNKSNANAGNRMIHVLLRGATQIAYISDGAGYTNTTMQLISTTNSINYLDSPATTSATTYKTQFSSNSNTASVAVQVNGSELSTIILMEIGA
jgi:3-deoxy-D-arabino-heptulosonate 7-phosphate (DAHP) synthase